MQYFSNIILIKINNNIKNVKRSTFFIEIYILKYKKKISE